MVVKKFLKEAAYLKITVIYSYRNTAFTEQSARLLKKTDRNLVVGSVSSTKSQV